MRVDWSEASPSEEGEERDEEEPRAGSEVVVLESIDAATGPTTWRLADVRANHATKGKRGLSKAQRDRRFVLGVGRVTQARLHVDFGT